MTEEEREKLAAGLSEAQRRAVIHACDPLGHDKGSFFLRIRAAGGWRTTNKLWEAGLTDEDAYLTDLGLALRHHLERKQG